MNRAIYLERSVVVNMMARFLRFIGITTILSLGLFAFIAPVLGTDEAVKLTVLMILPIMWWTRIVVALGTGRITRRFGFINNANRSTVLSLTNPDIAERRPGGWSFYAYVVREAFMCTLVWLVMGGGMIYPRRAETLGFPH